VGAGISLGRIIHLRRGNFQGEIIQILKIKVSILIIRPGIFSARGGMKVIF
jgi:hypothetical protein